MYSNGIQGNSIRFSRQYQPFNAIIPYLPRTNRSPALSSLALIIALITECQTMPKLSEFTDAQVRKLKSAKKQDWWFETLFDGRSLVLTVNHSGKRTWAV